MATPITTTGRPVSRPNTPSTPANQSGPGWPPSPGNSSLPQTPGGAQNHQTAVANSSSLPTTSTHTQPPSLPAVRPPQPAPSISPSRYILALFTKLRRAFPCFSTGTWIGLVFAIFFGVVTWRASQYQSMVAFHDACLNRRDHNLTVSSDCEEVLQSSPKAPSTFFKRSIESADITHEEKTLYWTTMIVISIMTIIYFVLSLRGYAEDRKKPFVSAAKMACYAQTVCERCSAPMTTGSVITTAPGPWVPDDSLDAGILAHAGSDDEIWKDEASSLVVAPLQADSPDAEAHQNGSLHNLISGQVSPAVGTVDEGTPEMDVLSHLPSESHADMEELPLSNATTLPCAYSALAGHEGRHGVSDVRYQIVNTTSHHGTTLANHNGQNVVGYLVKRYKHSNKPKPMLRRLKSLLGIHEDNTAPCAAASLGQVQANVGMEPQTMLVGADKSRVRMGEHNMVFDLGSHCNDHSSHCNHAGMHCDRLRNLLQNETDTWS